MFFLWTLKQNLINSDFCIPYFVKNVNEIIKQNLQIFYSHWQLFNNWYCLTTFYTTWNHKKSSIFLIPSGKVERVRQLEMGQCNLQADLSFLVYQIYRSQFQIAFLCKIKPEKNQSRHFFDLKPAQGHVKSQVNALFNWYNNANFSNFLLINLPTFCKYQTKTETNR